MFRIYIISFVEKVFESYQGTNSWVEKSGLPFHMKLYGKNFKILTFKYDLTNVLQKLSSKLLFSDNACSFF